MIRRLRGNRYLWAVVIVAVLWIAGSLIGQVNNSGGATQVTVSSIAAGANIIGKVGVDQTTPGTTNAVSLGFIGSTTTAAGNGVAGSGVQRVTIASDNTPFSVNASLAAGVNLIGFTMLLPSGCSGSGTALVVHNTVGVATGTGTSVSAVTGCIVEGFVNNITNSPVTFRLADKTGTPIIWLGGNADFTISANSNFGLAGNNGVNLAGLIMTSGITAIAGTAAALNLHLITRE